MTPGCTESQEPGKASHTPFDFFFPQEHIFLCHWLCLLEEGLKEKNLAKLSMYLFEVVKIEPAEHNQLAEVP